MRGYEPTRILPADFPETKRSVREGEFRRSGQNDRGQMVGKLAPVEQIAGLALKNFPSQVEIDAVAHYIEAALDLRRSPQN
jgi:hypothetical protein